jgi:hypothetical protein
LQQYFGQGDVISAAVDAVVVASHVAHASSVSQ